VIALLADENLNGAIVEGLRYQRPSLDLVRVQDVGLSGAGDPMILEWAAREGRVLLTHDVRTMPDFVWERVARGLPLAGVVVIRDDLSVGHVIDDLFLMLDCTSDDEWPNTVWHLPL
jgi:predicted nuclease of predicted toxin-antitoxin system